MYENPYQYLSGNIGDKKLIRADFEEKLYDTGQIKLNYVVGPHNFYVQEYMLGHQTINILQFD